MAKQNNGNHADAEVRHSRNEMSAHAENQNISGGKTKATLKYAHLASVALTHVKGGKQAHF